MELFNFKCKYCGGEMGEIEGLKSVGKCKYCGSKQTLPKLYDEKRATLFGRANHMRRNNEFDKAEALYEHILNEDPSDPEAYWSLVLCRFGIEYVEDANTKERKPTVNRTQMTSVFADENYKSAIKNADDEQKKLYEQEAEVINNIQKGILQISRKEEPFDVFICYKETNEAGKRSQDSVLAYNVYRELTRSGYKVFYARETLSEKMGSEYEPYIFSALNSAKVMVVLGTKKEHFEAAWVRNEWSRFQGMIKNGEEKVLLPLYKDIDAYDLPKEFANLQALDMSRIGYMQELLEGIDRICKIIDEHKPHEGQPDSTTEIIAENIIRKKKSKIIIPIVAAILAVAIGISAFVILDQRYSDTIPEQSSSEESTVSDNNSGDETEAEKNTSSIKNEMYGITVSSSDVQIPSDAKLSVNEVKSGDSHDLVESALSEYTSKFHAFDIEITKGDQTYSVNGEVTVSIPLPDDLDGTRTAVYYVSLDGIAERLNCNVSQGMVRFVTNHFSIYVIAEVTPETVTTEETTEETTDETTEVEETTTEEVTTEIEGNTTEETTTKVEETTTDEETTETDHIFEINETSESIYGTDGMITGTKYTVSCSCGCGTVLKEYTVSSNVNAYISPATLVAEHGFHIIRSVKADSDYYYHATYDGYINEETGLPISSQHIWLREKYLHPDGTDNFAGGESEFSENINIGNAKYLVIKLRTNSFDEDGVLVDPIKLMMSTTGWNYEQASAKDSNSKGWESVATKFEMCPKESDVWTTFVVDLAILGEHYAEDAEGGYVIDTFCLMQDDLLIASGSYLDIGYVAFVDSIIEARAIADTATLTSIAANKREKIICKGKCQDNNDDSKCDVCGVSISYTLPEKLKDGDGTVNKVLKLEELIGPKDTLGAAINCVSSEKNGNLYIENEYNMQYLWLRERYYTSEEDMNAQNEQLGLPIKSMGETTIIDVGTARYMMIKLKTDLTANHTIRLSTTAFNYNHATVINQIGILADLRFETIGNENWAVYVFDLDAFGEKGAAIDGFRSIDSLIFTSGAKAGYYEIEYIAFADDWSEVVSQAGAQITTFNYIYASGQSTVVDVNGNKIN